MTKLFSEELIKKLNNIASSYGLLEVRDSSGASQFDNKWVSTYTSIELNEGESDPLQLELIDLPELVTQDNIFALDDLILDLSNAKDAFEEMHTALDNAE